MAHKNIDKIPQDVPQSGYRPFLQDILTIIQQSRYEMLKSVSKQTLLLYWNIGSVVSLKIESEGWGNSVVEQLSKDLQTEFPGIRGFSARNIRNMKRFYEFYVQFGISATTVAELDEKQISAATVAEFQKEEILIIDSDENKGNVNLATAVAKLQSNEKNGTVSKGTQTTRMSRIFADNRKKKIRICLIACNIKIGANRCYLCYPRSKTLLRQSLFPEITSA